MADLCERIHVQLIFDSPLHVELMDFASKDFVKQVAMVSDLLVDYII